MFDGSCNELIETLPSGGLYPYPAMGAAGENAHLIKSATAIREPSRSATSAPNALKR